MKCKVCGGTGVIQGQAPGLVSCCPACDGKGFIEQTNEEWFCSLSTEEKVSALLNLHEKVRQRMRTDIGGENSFYRGDYYREWLKEKHNHETD